jgi:serine/threonine-protein kinase HipA
VKLWVCRKAAPSFRLGASEAESIIDAIVTGVREHWEEAADAAGLTRDERATLMNREILNPYIFYGQP